jgi:hypothetical protein
MGVALRSLYLEVILFINVVLSVTCGYSYVLHGANLADAASMQNNKNKLLFYYL